MSIQSIFGIAYLIGRIIIPILSDLIGRRNSMLVVFFTGIVSFVLQILSITYKNDYGIFIGHFLSGIFGSGLGSISYYIVCDFCYG